MRLLSKSICPARTAGSLVLAGVLVAACGPSGETASPASVAEPSSSSTNPLEATTTTPLSVAPVPIVAWGLRGDEMADLGGVDLALAGGYSLGDDGVAFDGVTGMATSIEGVPVDTEESLSISAWVAHTDQFVDVPMVVSVTSDPLSGEQDVSIGIGIGGSVWIFGQGAGPMVDGPKAAIADEWVHLVGVSDREAGELRFYVNGSLVGTARATTAPFAAGGPVIVGGGPDANWWAGAITDVAIYQQALTDDQVSKLHQGSRPESEPPLWHPDPSTYADGALDGTWDYDLSVAADGAILAQLESDLGRSLEGASIRLGFDGPKWWQGFAVNGELTPIGPDPVGDVGTVTIDGDRLTVTAWAWVTTYRWDLAADRLELELLEQCERQTDQCFTGADIDEVDPFVRAITQHTFTKSGTDPTY